MTNEMPNETEKSGEPKETPAADPVAGLSPDYLLTRFVQQLAKNYSRLDASFHGGCVYFVVDDGDTVHPRTVLMDATKPRLFTGIIEPESENLPFVGVKLTVQQLAGLLSGTLNPEDPANSNVEFSGNSEKFYEAVGRCL